MENNTRKELYALKKAIEESPVSLRLEEARRALESDGECKALMDEIKRLESLSHAEKELSEARQKLASTGAGKAYQEAYLAYRHTISEIDSLLFDGFKGL